VISVRSDGVNFDPLDLSYQVDPYPHFKVLREQPAVWVGALGAWFIGRYKDVRAMSSDTETFSQTRFAQIATGEFDYAPTADQLISTDPPEHTRLRKLFSYAFRPRQVREMEEAIVGITDSYGLAALLFMSADKAKSLGLKPIARVHTATLAGADPVIMLTAPNPATQKALKESGLKMEDIGVFEVNEAFVPVPLRWLKDIGADEKELNPNGGAIAFGHPLGGSAARIMTTMRYHMRDKGIRYGLQTMCGAARPTPRSSSCCDRGRDRPRRSHRAAGQRPDHHDQPARAAQRGQQRGEHRGG
jgi:hypothetical protein